MADDEPGGRIDRQIPPENKTKTRWVKVPFPNPVHGDLAWHYTDTAGLLGIVESHSLWASAPTSLNDASELRYGADLVRSLWEEERESYPGPCVEFIDTALGEDLIEDVRDQVFVLSASFNGDLLNQWQHYARRGGYALAIDTKSRLAPRSIFPGVPVQDQPRGVPHPGWRRVVYEETQQAYWVRQMLDHVANLTPGTPETWQDADNLALWPRMSASSRISLQTLSCQLKDPAFAVEDEARFLATLPPDGLFERFRATGAKIVPYVMLGSVDDRSDGRLPIMEIRCGPSSNADAEATVRRLLDAAGYPDVVVSSSVIPFR